MNLKLFVLASILAPAALSLTSCGTGGGRPDVVNPTVSQMDELDVQWGLPKRTGRGGPRRFESSGGYTPSAAASTPASAPAAPAAASKPSAAPAPASSNSSPVDPNVIKSLR